MAAFVPAVILVGPCFLNRNILGSCSSTRQISPGWDVAQWWAPTSHVKSQKTKTKANPMSWPSENTSSQVSNLETVKIKLDKNVNKMWSFFYFWVLLKAAKWFHMADILQYPPKQKYIQSHLIKNNLASPERLWRLFPQISGSTC